MKLKDLIREWPTLKVIGSKQIEITGIASDSRTVAPGNLFIAKKGNLQSGLEFVAQAVEAGASAIVSPIYNPFLKQTQLIHEEPELLEAYLAARYYGRPSKDLLMFGVTGSKGKTTTTYLLRHLLQGIGQPCGLLNTIEISIGKKYLPSLLTTHDAIWNQKLLREMVDSQCKAAVLEVSSHALAQRRVLEIDFDVAIFTNLYPDHLDYHKNLEAYALEKRKLFAMAKMGIYNADSPWTPFMREDRNGLTFGIQEPADIRAENISLLPGKAYFTVQNHPFSISMMGRFNIANVLGAIAAGVYLGVPLDTLSSLLAEFPGVPGRLENVPNDLGISVFIDYAHTGEALENVLQTLREIASGKIIVVFGCGGGRDPGRRPAMGRAASGGARERAGEPKLRIAQVAPARSSQDSQSSSPAKSSERWWQGTAAFRRGDRSRTSLS